MKVFDVERRGPQPLTPGEELPVVMVPDSAITRPGVPLFVPGFAERWQAEVVPVFEIGRLGKCIGEGYALRYVRGMGVGVRLMPEDGCVGQAQRACFDGALCVGQFTEFKAEGWDLEVRQTEIDSPEELLKGRRWGVGFEEFDLEALVARLSSYCTLKTGDLIIPFHFPGGFAARLNTRLTATLNGEWGALSLKIK